MTKAEMNPKVDGFLRKAKQWQEEFTRLRRIVLDCGLTEEMKWMHPCYSLEGKNVVLIHGFKEYCALLFMKGALLKDADGILKTIGQTQAGRHMRFTSAGEIAKLAPVIKAYIQEAIAVEKAGLKVKLKKTAEFKVPEELKKKFAETPALKSAFDALTPGRQRGYLFYFSGAKQSKTREARIEKVAAQILRGRGLND